MLHDLFLRGRGLKWLNITGQHSTVLENAKSTSDGMRDCNGLNPSSNLDDQMRMFQDDNGEYVGHGDHGGKAGGRDGRRHIDQRTM